MYDYGYYGSYYADSAALVGVGMGVILVTLFIALAIAILQIVAMWKIFTKAGEEGWKAIIPVYNMITLFKISGLSPLFVLVYLAGIIPFVGSLAILGITIYLNYSLAKSFGKDTGFVVGLTLLGPIFYLILGFGKDQYVGSHYQSNSTPNVNQ